MYLPSDAPVLVFIGPSGTGKSTAATELVHQNIIELTPTWTDRPARPAEPELEHRFVTTVEFDALVEAQFFAHEPLTFFGLPYRYATPRLKTPTGKQTPAIMARVAALPLIDRLYPNRILYQIEAPYKLVAERLHERTLAGDKLGSRLSDYATEVERGRKYAQRIFVNESTIEAMVADITVTLGLDF